LERSPSDEGPLVGLIKLVDDLVHQRMPALEAGGTFAPGALLGPRLDLPVVALAEADEVHDLAAPQGIGDDVAAWPDPVGAPRAAQLRRQVPQPHQPAPADDAHELGLAGGEHLMADGRVHTVGTDECISCYPLAASELQCHARAVLGEARA